MPGAASCGCRSPSASESSIYFGLPAEPWAPALMALAAVLTVAAWRARFRTVAFRILVVAACVACGALAAKVRTDMVAAPVLSREMTVTVSGWIAEREEAARGGVRVLVRVHEIAGIAASSTPVLVRVTVRSHGDTLAVGDAVTMRARLQPPGGAVMPGGYDFARVAFYERIGAVGFVYGAAKPADIGPPPLGIRLSVPLAHLRDTIRRRVEAALPGDNGHLAAALVMGDRGGISEATQEAMRASGLAHMLAISGLHMALVAGSAFWLIRALLALSTGARAQPPDQEMGRGGRAGGRRRLSWHFRRRHRDAARLRHARHHAGCRHARPPGDHAAQRRAGRVRHPHRRAGEPDHRELPDVVRGDGGAGRGLRGDHRVARPPAGARRSRRGRHPRPASGDPPAVCCSPRPSPDWRPRRSPPSISSAWRR